tara:strand:+ start:1795 stop:2649 length:855 start_codon:yes stop_codon:yes gene_type:complete
MISVIEVYNTLRDLCNKEQKGFVTPEVFNSFADVCQVNIFNEMFTELSQSKRLRRSGFDPGRDKSLSKQINEDLSQFVTEARILATDGARQFLDTQTDGLVDSGIVSNSPYPFDSLTFEKPKGFAKMISISLISDDDPEIDIVYEPEKISRILRSNLSAPTEDFPVALISDNIQLFPDTLTDHISVIYYRHPKSLHAASIPSLDPDILYSVNRGDIDWNSTPTFSAQVLDTGTGLVIPNIVNCRDFELPKHYKNELIIELAKMIGIRLRDSFLSQFSIAQEQAE